jgi:putative component of membrane protein insertase Oxa1/YidC/SpoIIIJ protein YidD
MYKKYGYKIIFLIYQFGRQLRYSLLNSVFGVVSHCKHTPTCGTYMFQQIKKRGMFLGLVLGFKRVISCW